MAHLKEISSALSSISFALPEFFTNGLDFSSGKKNESVMLREWELESEHDYGNNMNFIKVMSLFLVCIISVLRKLCVNAFLIQRIYLYTNCHYSVNCRERDHVGGLGTANGRLEENPKNL